MFDISNIYIAKSSEEAVAALLKDDKARLIAGGTDILIKIRNGELAGGTLVSIHDIDELRGITQDDEGNLHLGPLTTFRELEMSPLILEHAPLLAEAAASMGGPQIRNVATLGGNICNGAVSADSAPALLVLQAELFIKNEEGIRPATINEFYDGPGRVRLEQSELLTRIMLRHEDFHGWQGAYRKYSMRGAMDISTIGVALMVKLTTDKGYIAQIRIACGVAGPTPLRLPHTEQELTGMSVNEALQNIAPLLRQEINPRDSWRAGADFRRQVAGENAKRALKELIVAAGGVC